jgi:hypothetical protein
MGIVKVVVDVVFVEIPLKKLSVEINESEEEIKEVKELGTT